MSSAQDEVPAARAGWNQAFLLGVAAVAFVWVSDLQGVVRHRDEYVTWSQWLRPMVSYVAAAGLVLWKWDQVVAPLLSWRFGVVLLGMVAAIALASRTPAPRVDSGVPVLRNGERASRSLVTLPLGDPARLAWQVPQVSHADVQAEEERQTPQDAGFEFDLPAGWKQVPASAMRPLNLRVARDERAECYLSSLPGAAGGLLDNVNRWRGQMGLSAIASADVDQLPKAKLLGVDAVLVELDGTFTGMGGASLSDARMLGAIAALPAVTLFLKMTGPRDVVGAERPGFDKVLSSLRRKDVPAPAPPRDGTQPPAAQKPTPQKPAEAPTATSGARDGVRWRVPEGWSVAADKPMRSVTFKPAGTTDVDCYVSVLPGTGGGLLQNVNRWRGQFGAAPITEAELQKLPQIRVAGKPAALVEAAGTFTGMGAAPKAGYALLGVVASGQDAVVFVKMTGPQAEVQGERARFLTFCEGLAIE